MRIHGRPAFRRLRDAVAGIASVALLLTGVLVVATVSQRNQPAAGSDGSPAAVAAAAATPGAGTVAPPTIESSAVTASPTSAADPTSVDSPVPKPTRTPRPVVDTVPEGTPHYHLVSGRLGETIVNDEISIRVDRAAIPATYDYGLCTRGNPAYTEAFAFKITETWTRWTSVEWVFEMGNTQPVVNWFEDPPDYGNGQSNVLVACHKPGASSTIVIYSGPLTSTDVPEDYEWTIR